MKQLTLALCAILLSFAAVANEDAICLDCHEPELDWKGLSVEEIVAAGLNPENKRHRVNFGADEDEMTTFILRLLEEE